MTLLDRYNHKTQEKHWQQQWEQHKIYAFCDDQPRDLTYVIDTPPPTVSGQLHMGHIYSYTHADFMARYKRMKGYDVCYPMGFDDNGLPTERLVEKQEKVRAKDVSRETFISLCEKVSEEARREFRSLFSATALSVDWGLEYHTISEEVRRLSQASFIDLYENGHVERRLQPMLWDVVDQTAIAQAEVEDKEMEGVFVDIRFEVCNIDGTPLDKQQFGNRKLNESSEQDAIIWHDGKSYVVIGTTRPELIPACVGVFFNNDDARYRGLEEKKAITPLFGVEVDIYTDESVEINKGTGIMMCCTFGDEADIEKWRKHKLETRIIINKYGKISSPLAGEQQKQGEALSDAWGLLQGLSVKAARAKIIELLQDAEVLEGKKAIIHAVKCAERSGAPLEILPSQQWFVKILDHKEALKEKSKACNWNPAWMQKRMEQWIDGLNWDWCISRQRYYGVPFPVWLVKNLTNIKRTIYFLQDGSWVYDEPKHYIKKFHRYESRVTDPQNFTEKEARLLADLEQLPVDPLNDLPLGFRKATREEEEAFIENRENKFSYFPKEHLPYGILAVAEKDIFFPNTKKNFCDSNDLVFVIPDKDVMDTWATSSLTPQITAGDVIAPNKKLFPADLRPQAHEIIRTWAFYTLVKAHLHNDAKPWENLMISGWCLASDKTKMSKSKGNIITPLALLEEKSADAVRYWASTAKLGTDTAFSEDLLKIGAKLVNKLWNASKFVGGLLQEMTAPTATATQAIGQGVITYEIDKWVLARVQQTIMQADACFAAYDYAGARAATEVLFWNDVCDNYLEIVKSRAYGNMGEAGQKSALHTMYHALNALLKLFAPFVPHITEELFSLLYVQEYAEKKSIHARGMFPNAEAYGAGVEYDHAEAQWEQTKAVVELIRKAKSERGVSIKYPIDCAMLEGVDANLFAPIQQDIQAVGNIAVLECGAPTAEMVTLQDEAHNLTLHVLFAEKAEVAL